MIRTEWLNTSVDDLRSTFRGRCNCQLAHLVDDLRDTAVEAFTRHGHRTRAWFLLTVARRAEAGCPGVEKKREHSRRHAAKRGVRS